MAPNSSTPTEPLAAGHDALARAAWSDAREAFEAALEAGDSAEAWEGLGWAAWWTSDAELTFRARERAYRAHRAAGDPAGAGRVAAWLASDFLEYRGEDAVARGWLERSHRLLDPLPRGADHGWLALNEGGFVLNVDDDLDGAARLAATATALGRELAVADLEAVGLALEGITRVRRGDVEAGMRCLDEAAAIAAGEDLQLPISHGWSLCYLISACEGVGDFPRATQWCDAVRALSERWGGRQLLGVCRSAYGRVLATGGDWVAAETELTAAIEDLRASRPAMAGGGLVRLAELRARQGRGEEARELFEAAGPHRMALVGLGALALDAGDAAGAADAAERALRRAPTAAVLDRLPALELLVRARACQGELELATTACAELERAAAALGTAYVVGRARAVAGELAAASGDHEASRRACEDAVDHLTEAAAIHDAALARLELSRALAALGRQEAAAAEADAARAVFLALGADRDVARAEAPPVSAQSLGDLTARELEVLRLVAQGLGDHEIAERLVLSPHTVHRHMANVRTKLRLPSRSAAVAYAARAGLL